MPEGDSIHRIANKLADLVGQPIEHATTQGLVRPALAGRVIAAITAIGKHLVIDTLDPRQRSRQGQGLEPDPRTPPDTGTQIRAHLGMYGRFRRLARADGEQTLARTSPGRVTLALTLPTAVLVWLGAKTLEIADRRAPRRGLAVAALGPDILADTFDPATAAARAAAADVPIATTLLDQRVVAGIGNVYKSEVLFVVGVDPRTPTAALSLATLTDLYREAARLMRANVGPALRTRQTTRLDRPVRADEDRYFVYGRAGQPCRRCAALIACFSQGDPPRWTWACPRCQPPSPG